MSKLERKIDDVFKRLYDLIFAILFLIVFSPLYLITAIIIMITSPGTPIYKAQRVGKDGKIFTCYKFRSMRIDSGKVRLTTLRNDDRIFPFGRLIRKTKIDEMPQVLNVLLGQMSVVGPRPEDRENADVIYKGKYKKLLSVKPGLTSIASLYDYTHGEKYDSEEKYYQEFLPQKLELELFYVNHHNVLYDLVITIRTVIIIIQTLFGKEYFKYPKELKIIYEENKCVENDVYRSNQLL